MFIVREGREGKSRKELVSNVPEISTFNYAKAPIIIKSMAVFPAVSIMLNNNG